MEETIKAGCILVDKDIKNIAIVYRVGLKDYSFPKGHLEDGESLEECAIRETAEETKRIAVIDDRVEAYVERYITPSGVNCVAHFYLAVDGGESDNDSLDTHPTHWIPIDEVEGVLTYPRQRETWKYFKDKIKSLYT